MERAGALHAGGEALQRRKTGAEDCESARVAQFAKGLV